jgi:hypothetical protein
MTTIYLVLAKPWLSPECAGGEGHKRCMELDCDCVCHEGQCMCLHHEEEEERCQASVRPRGIYYYCSPCSEGFAEEGAV